MPRCGLTCSTVKLGILYGCHFAVMGPQARTLCLLSLLLHVLPKPGKLVENSDFHLAGDYLLGGLFTLHANVKSISHLSYLQVPKCNE